VRREKDRTCCATNRIHSLSDHRSDNTQPRHHTSNPFAPCAMTEGEAHEDQLESIDAHWRYGRQTSPNLRPRRVGLFLRRKSVSAPTKTIPIHPCRPAIGIPLPESTLQTMRVDGTEPRRRESVSGSNPRQRPRNHTAWSWTNSPPIVFRRPCANLSRLRHLQRKGARVSTKQPRSHVN
jgi:hypothetical protein